MGFCVFMGENMKRLIIIFLLVLGITTNANAFSDEWSKILYNSVRYHENGNDVIVDIESINKSLSNGANPNYINPDDKNTVLSHYINLISAYGRDDAVVSQGCKVLNILFNAGAKLGKEESDMFYLPIANGQTCVAEILLNNGASATSWDKYKIGTELSPIEVAEANGHKEIVDLLIKHGATSISSEKILQLRLVEVAESGSLLQLQEIIREGAQVNTAGHGNSKALISAISAGVFAFNVPEYCAKVFYLLDQGADINLVGEGREGETTPLHALTYYSSYILKRGKDTSCVKQLIDHFIDKGAYVSRQDNTGSTPLHLAAKYNNLYAANKLLTAGCKIMTKDFKGKTPLDLAESKEMIKLLKKYRAKEN